MNGLSIPRNLCQEILHSQRIPLHLAHLILKGACQSLSLHLGLLPLRSFHERPQIELRAPKETLSHWHDHHVADLSAQDFTDSKARTKFTNSSFAMT